MNPGMSAALAPLLNHPNVRAFALVVRKGEGTLGENGYRTMFGGELFDSFADHPRRRITRSMKGKTYVSSAAGAYQFLESTWDGLVRNEGYKDFTPQTQDLAFLALVRGRKALEDVVAGRFEQAVAKCAREWASLPGSPYGQPTTTLDAAQAFYLLNGGSFERHSPVETLPPVTEPLKEPPMPPFVLAALPALINAVPKLFSIFGDGSEVAKRNEAAVQIAVDVAKAAAGVPNEQALIEAVKDPAVAETVRKAIEERWYEITVNTEGIGAARKANSEATEFWKQPGIWVSAALLPLVYIVVVKVLFGDFSDEIRIMVISAIISGVLSAITGFWLGTSFSSARKTDIMNR